MKAVVTRLSVLRSSLIVIGLMFTSPCFAEIDPESIIGAWLFDEGEGDEVRDSYGGNDGTFVGDGLGWVDGVFSGALDFNGKHYVVLAKDLEGLEANATKTITAWLKISDAKKAGQVFIANEQSGWNGWWVQLGFQGGHSKVGFLSQAQVDQSTGEVEEGEWAHIAVVLDYDKSKIFFYINGALDNSVDREILITPSPLNPTIGAEARHAQRFFSGVLDELLVFDVALSENDIKTIMTLGILRATAVEYAGKLTTTWAAVKFQY